MLPQGRVEFLARLCFPLVSCKKRHKWRSKERHLQSGWGFCLRGILRYVELWAHSKEGV